MGLSLLKKRGTPLDRQRFTWREMVQTPITQLDDDAFTRVRVILMNGVENEALRFGHSAARRNEELRVPLAEARRVEQHQATMINWLLGDYKLMPRNELWSFHPPEPMTRRRRTQNYIVTAVTRAPCR